MATWRTFPSLFPGTAEPCPAAGPIVAATRPIPQILTRHTAPQSIVEWATTQLGFTPSPKQAEVLESDAKYLILCCNRQWGKTTTIAAKALYAALQTPKLKIAVIARSQEQAGILIENATEFAITLGHRTRRVPGKPYSLQLPNMSKIFAVPHTQHSSLGRTANILIVDEAAKVSDDVYYAVSPFVSRTHGKIWMLSTPTRQSGFFYNFWHDSESDWHRIFSNVQDCPDIDADYLAMQRRANPIRYSQDFLCQFTQPANRLGCGYFGTTVQAAG